MCYTYIFYVSDHEKPRDIFFFLCWSSKISNVVILTVLWFCWFNGYFVVLYLSFGYTQGVYSINEFPKTRQTIANLVLNGNVSKKERIEHVWRTKCFSYYLNNLRYPRVSLTVPSLFTLGILSWNSDPRAFDFYWMQLLQAASNQIAAINRSR